MKISELKIKNFRSFGNNTQTLKLNLKKGDLILLSGRNGSGKSSLISAIDYTLYNKVQGNKKRWATLKSLPNRINGDMECSIKFESDSTDIEVIRGNNKLILKENNITNERAGKKNLDTNIENYIGMDIETFKSFISMSINDFKNFINLTNAEKKLLLDKLFNLETINILNDILKKLMKENKSTIDKYDSEIKGIDSSIERIKISIEKNKKKKVIDNENNLKLLKEEYDSNKEKFDQIREKIQNIKEKNEHILSKIDVNKESYITTKNEIKNIDQKIKLYENDKCPECGSDLNDDHHKDLKKSFTEKKESLNLIKENVTETLKDLKIKKDKLTKMDLKAVEMKTDLSSILRSLKRDIEKIQSIKESKNEDNTDIKEFVEAIDDLKDQRKGKNSHLKEMKDKNIYHKELSKVFSENGIKKVIINNILEPINHFIEENLEKMNMSHRVELDSQFNANVTMLGQDIDPETLSTGETKKVNVAILIAYLKMIRTKKVINVLFLDEVFASIDVEGIEDILSLLRDFANNYNINIFVVHHAILNQQYFDRILLLEKEVFTEIKEL